MNPERWRQIERLYNSALELEPDRRESFLKEACAGDESLRSEVAQLLASQPQIEHFIESPALEVAAKTLAREEDHPSVRDLTGCTVYRYHIIKKIGQGGMGEIFLADDTALHRKVALKFLPPEMQKDPAARKRFLGEARSAAALDHPYICHINEVGEFEGNDFIAMEYVDGQTLMDRLRRKPMPLNHAIQIATEVADALQVAHAKGIIHRDLKPSNIMLTQTGHAKVMDFGLAKQIIPSCGIESRGETVSAMTRTGMTLGTLAYMSPEQLRGEPADIRSDIFSFGLVLYEMLTGAHPFRKESPMETGSAILHEEPKPVGAAAFEIPPDLEKLVSRCLRKDPARRFYHMGDIKVELEDLNEKHGSRQPAEAGNAIWKVRMRWLWAASLGIALLSAGTWLWHVRAGRELPPPRVVTLTSEEGSQAHPTFSPDGNKIAFEWERREIGHPDIYVKAVGDSHASQLTRDPAGSHSPEWSPDERDIVFLRDGPAEKAGIYLISPLGGPERKISDFNCDSVSWTPDGKSLVAARSRPDEFTGEDPSGIYLIPSGGGPERRITSPKAPTTDNHPSISPNGKLLVFARWTFYQSDIYCQPLGSDGSPQGEARRIPCPSADTGRISWSRDSESIIFGSEKVYNRPYLWRIWIKSDAPPIRLEVAGPNAFAPAVAPLGNRLAFASGRVFGKNIWSFQPGSAPRVFTTSSAEDDDPDFSPDGMKVAFASSRAGETYDIWVCDTDGFNPTQLTHEDGNAGTPHWSPDGKLIVFDVHGADGSASLYTVNPSGGRSHRLTPGTVEAVMGCWSPDGKWIYFTSDRSGRREIWRMPAAGGDAQQVSRQGADNARVSLDGKTIYFTKGGSLGLFDAPSGGGEETKIADSCNYRSFAVTKRGVYYTRRREKDRLNELCLLDPSTFKSRVVSVLEGDVWAGMTVSPNGKTALYTRGKEAIINLMLIENFR